MYRGGHDTGASAPAELESQFILRLPEEPAKILRSLLSTNASLKDRFVIRIDNDMRSAEVRVDHHLLKAKVVDLPTIIESLKTIDLKSFYKTADICQMLVCKAEDDLSTEEDSPQKSKKKDPNKVDKKFLWPHGITAPVKNSRKRRFRKTLRKKYAEAPEIEKEVKRLLRCDTDAVSVKWEVINEEDENKVNKGTVMIKKEPIEPESVSQSIAEHDIFGGAVSDSDDEDAHLNVLDMDENSQNSAEDSHLTDSNSVMNSTMSSKMLTEFSREMFSEDKDSLQAMDFYEQSQPSASYSSPNVSKKAMIESRLEELHIELMDLRNRRQQQELEIENLENLALRQRFQDILDRLLQEQIEKEHEKFDLQEMLKNM